LTLNNSTYLAMALQIANPIVVAKVDRLARARGMTKTAVVEQAVDMLAASLPGDAQADASMTRIRALLAQIDRIPDRADAADPLRWDERGLPA
jgi:antitoxin VapB